MTEPAEGLELLMTSDPLPSEDSLQQQEPPKRRRGRPRKIDAASDDEPSTDGSAKPRRTYTRRSGDPCKQVALAEEQIETLLAGGYMLLGGAVAMVLPVTGMTIAIRSQAGAQAVLTAAKSNPTLASWLLKAMKTSAWAPLVIWSAGVGVAALVDVGMMPPQNPMVQRVLGEDVLPAIYATMQMQAAQQQAAQQQAASQSPNGQVPNASTEAAQYEAG